MGTGTVFAGRISLPCASSEALRARRAPQCNANNWNIIGAFQFDVENNEVNAGDSSLGSYYLLYHAGASPHGQVGWGKEC